MLRFSNPDTFTPAPLYSSELRYILEKLRKIANLNNAFKIGVLVAGGYSSSYLNSTEVYRYATHHSTIHSASFLGAPTKEILLFLVQAVC